MYLKHVVDVQGQRQADVVLTAAEGGARDHGAQGRGALQGEVIDRTQQVLLIQRRKTQSFQEPERRVNTSTPTAKH